MFSLIFLHGALLGGWVWQEVAPIFKRAGYEVMTPDLAGRGGETKGVTLQTHIDLVAPLVEKAKYPVVLVAHSMSGIVASQLAEIYSSKIKKIIFVSAYLPQNGESLETIFEGYFGPLVYDKESMSIKMGLQLKVEDLINVSFSDCPDKMKQMVRDKAVSEPIIPSLEKISLTPAKYGAVSKAFIKLPKDKVIPIELQNIMINKAGISEVEEMGTGHAPFCAAPEKLVEVIYKFLNK